jgi:hypothetical protein
MTVWPEYKSQDPKLLRGVSTELELRAERGCKASYINADTRLARLRRVLTLLLSTT